MIPKTLFIPLKMVPQKSAPVEVNGRRVGVINASRTIGYIPVYESLEALQEDYGKDAPYNKISVEDLPE